jgi:hypothetical protein
VGVADVVAIAGGPGAVTRVEIQRGVDFQADRRVTLDLAGRGTELIPVDVSFGGDPPTTATVRLLTAGATPVPLTTVTARVVPIADVFPGDLQTVEVSRDGAWAKAAIDEHGGDLPHPGAPPDLGFAWTARPTWSWRWRGGYRATLTVSAAGGDAPRWTLFAYPGALTARAADGFVAQPLEAPAVTGWDPAWWPTAPYQWSARLTHDREDGGSEGFAEGRTIAAP